MTGPILVFHRALGFVHRSIPDAVDALHRLGDANGFPVDATDDPASLAESGLERYTALVFVHTSGNVVPGESQRRALEAYMAGGGGFLGIHAASSMGEVADEWPWYRELIGARFVGHTAARIFCDEPFESEGALHAGPFSAAPDGAEELGPGMAMTTWEEAVVHVEDPACPAGRGLTDGAVVDDEWYGFDANPRPYVNVVATVDESTYEPFQGRMGEDHPIIWWRSFGGGRSVYNAMGHAAWHWRDDTFLRTVLGGIEWAAGR